ncbi:NAD(P)H-binding protein [Rheinheimera maricola]|uniref:NAD(P)H-binding protein n=1 Tax=Rheinheimera maricola TaxID=2793282 RepID=A0ABS7X7Y3_9GAMM|nr:NAD(P)H-binding protein [Rheinheimera maricola]MBZ9611220.1 NAD(P)H-binding protein [Rheinheimera maricola]
MKVIVVGCGWLGSQLAQQLASEGHQVWATRRTVEALATLPAQVHGLVVDLTNIADITPLQPVFDDAIVICAVAPGRHTEQSHYIAALQQLARLATTAGSRQLIHFSSTGIYQGLSGAVDEAAMLVQADTRVSLLLQGEQALQQFAPTLTLRLAGLMGPGRHPGRFITGRVLPDANGAINMVHVWDVIAAVMQVLAALPCEGIYNLSSPLMETRQAFYHAAAELALQTPASFSGGDAGRKIVAGKFIQQFGFRYQFSQASAALIYCD